MKWINKHDNNAEPWENQETDALEAGSKARSWQKVFGGIILCAIALFTAMVVYGLGTGLIQERGPEGTKVVGEDPYSQGNACLAGGPNAEGGRRWHDEYS